MEQTDDNPGIHDMLRDWLTQHGYTGLCNPDLECGCILRNLAPCGTPGARDCVAGYARGAAGVFLTRDDTHNTDMEGATMTDGTLLVRDKWLYGTTTDGVGVFEPIGEDK